MQVDVHALLQIMSIAPLSQLGLRAPGEQPHCMWWGRWVDVAAAISRTARRGLGGIPKWPFIDVVTWCCCFPCSCSCSFSKVLRRAAKCCEVLQSPLLHQRSHLTSWALLASHSLSSATFSKVSLFPPYAPWPPHVAFQALPGSMQH